MGSLERHMCLVVALSLSLCNAEPESLVVVVRSPISVPRGHTTTLPCWLNPPQSAEGLEVRWYRPNHFDSPVLLYLAKKFDNATQEASFRGRVSFGLKDVVSGGLKAGDVSLKLTNVTLEDAGGYTCYVSSDQVYDSTSVSLNVTQTGTSPLLSAVRREDHMVNVSCESEGWYPEPSLRWSDPKQAQSSKNTKYSKDSSGLLSVHSWILVSGSTEVSCSVGLSGPEAKWARMRLEKPPQAECGSSHGGWIAFVLLLILMLALLGVYFYKKRVKKARVRRDNDEESQKLLTRGDILSPDLSHFNYANVTLENVGNPNLTVRGCMVRDAGCPGIPGGTCLTAIRGTPGFSSGLHYWEVSMENINNVKIGLKESWWVGVTSATEISQDTSPTTSNGFWFLSSSPDRPDRFQFSTEPNVLLPVRSRPQTVGVYLNYDSGELSFYNAKDKSLIGSFKANFTGEVFPLFNPGVGDTAPMTILQREKHSENNDVQENPLLPKHQP
ncbi:butyrophilin subfamily 3 member A3-like [Labrus mixtus]|uniref:butyrophilin subfamily 3 member A3-like n=1 Tax=Labrus mixtus TaxID=508554 RepID=UPI0029C01ED5|nr:butyrophilin subfamily 3 member A3-like [Labrus mixtus]